MFLCNGAPLSLFYTHAGCSHCVVTGCTRGPLCHRCSIQYTTAGHCDFFCTFLATTVNAFVNLGGFLPPLSYLDSIFVQSSLLGWQAQSLYHCMDLGGMDGEGEKTKQIQLGPKGCYMPYTSKHIYIIFPLRVHSHVAYPLQIFCIKSADKSIAIICSESAATSADLVKDFCFPVKVNRQKSATKSAADLQRVNIL